MNNAWNIKKFSLLDILYIWAPSLDIISNYVYSNKKFSITKFPYWLQMSLVYKNQIWHSAGEVEYRDCALWIMLGPIVNFRAVENRCSPVLWRWLCWWYSKKSSGSAVTDLRDLKMFTLVPRSFMWVTFLFQLVVVITFNAFVLIQCKFDMEFIFPPCECGSI